MEYNKVPTADGENNYYDHPEAIKEVGSTFQKDKFCVFINGMDNSGQDHFDSAQALSLMTMKRVYGTFNKSDGQMSDLLQCAADKFQFNHMRGAWATPALMQGQGLAKKLRDEGIISGDMSDEDVMRAVLGRNPSAVTLFNVLRKSWHRHSPIFAHSQGNIILSNVLAAIAAVDGDDAIKGREVHSYGSPVVNWPGGIVHQEYAFSGDMVALLAGIDWGFKISKVGMHDDSEEHGSTLNSVGKAAFGQRANVENFFSHGFLLYAANDARFVINRFATGVQGATVNMDEKGLAKALRSMGGNLRRVQAVFERLYSWHKRDSDDVAYYYLHDLKKYPHTNAAAIRALRQNKPLRDHLYKLLDERWTTSGESELMTWVKKLGYSS